MKSLHILEQICFPLSKKETFAVIFSFVYPSQELLSTHLHALSISGHSSKREILSVGKHATNTINTKQSTHTNDILRQQDYRMWRISV